MSSRGDALKDSQSGIYQNLKDIVIVQFGGRIGLCKHFCHVDQNRGLSFQTLSNIYKVGVGEGHDEHYIEDAPQVMLKFPTVESIDVVISALEEVKKDMIEGKSYENTN